MIPSLQPPRVDDPSGLNAIVAIDLIRNELGLPPSVTPNAVVTEVRRVVALSKTDLVQAQSAFFESQHSKEDPSASSSTDHNSAQRSGAAD